MNLLAWVPLYPPGSMVGSWVSTHLCLAHLVERGHRVDVVTYMGGGHAYDLDGVHVHPGARIEDFSPDVILSHLGDNARAAEVAKWAKLPSVRMVHGLHELNRHRLGRRPPALAVFNSESLRAATRWSGPSIVVHPPVDIDLPISKGDAVTLVNLSAEKGGGVFAQIARRMPEHRFLGVRGGYGRQVEVSGPNVEVVEPTHRMVSDVYARTRVLVMPSASETWGMVAVEAMASGIPVIAHPTPGLRESLGDAGIFADRGNVSEWVAAIRRLDGPDAWAATSERARARAMELDPAPSLARFADAVEALAGVLA